MSTYTLRDVERLLGLSRAVVQGFVEAGFVAPSRGARHELRFSFQDLILLKTAQGLAAVKIPTRRIKQALARLRAELPPSLPLSGIRICARDDRVVVQQGSSQWLADSGQYLLDFNMTPAPGDVEVLQKEETPPQETPPDGSAEHWFRRAGELEASDPDAAEQAYRTAIGHDDKFLPAYVNLGCLLQARGQAAPAERVYREAIAQFPDEPLLHFNLAIALEDQHRADDAVRAYAQAIALDAAFADAHYNLAKIYEERGRRQDAIRHLAEYRRLQQA
jgi:tetratricopeptide (TPR) repeat protein